MTDDLTGDEIELLDLLRTRLAVPVNGVDEDLFAAGLLDSLAVVMLIAAIEESYACVLPLDDFDLDDFGSVRRIALFLHRSGVAGSRSVL